ncbi:unnamed protein product [Acanthoscelides obtectus]|uniref:Uncharacterized protein n=1 Tax=Acanthoscelides obtectus TaxID=200917 RepID=A0A9P0KHT4_ACAOB|nr:unnamed protein product [Acanthoscelides obtectus]CAK1656529.1 hypothetical protein AOBTE_LOCUS19776 [Acanthoscelides obtectus]
MESREQAVRSMNIRIQRMDVQKDENIRSRVIRLFTNTLKINVQNSGIKKCHRVPYKNPGNKPPAVLVRFTSDSVRLSVLKNKKNLKKLWYTYKRGFNKNAFIIT